jgi:hypothetical protein
VLPLFIGNGEYTVKQPLLILTNEPEVFIFFIEGVLFPKKEGGRG